MLRENPGHNPNIAYSDQSYLLDVQVVWETEDNGSQTGNLKVSGIATTSAATNQKSEGAGFENTEADAESLKNYKNCFRKCCK